MMEIILPKSNARKTLNKNDLSTDIVIETLSRMLSFIESLINTIFLNIFLLLYRILAISFFKFTVKLTKPSRRHACLTVSPHLLQLSLKTLKKHLFKATHREKAP